MSQIEDEAKKIIEQEQTKRARECLQRIEAIVKEMNCRIDAVTVIKGNEVQSQIQVTAL